MQVPIAAQERNWAMAAHLSALVAIAGLPFGHLLGPLIVYLVKRDESEFVGQHARASLNYQITVSIFAIVAIIVFIGLAVSLAAGSDSRSEETGYAVGFVALWIAFGVTALLAIVLSIIFIIMGTVAANEGRQYTYPFAIRFLR
jgi:uncharacterized Tic20 family protein